MRRRRSTSFASSRRFSRWQSENQGDTRLGRVRTIISDGTYALLNAQQIKMVSSEACICAMCHRDSDHTYDDPQMKFRTNPTFTRICTSCHVCWGDKCDAPCISKTSSFKSLAVGTWNFEPLYTTTPASSRCSQPRNICTGCLFDRHLLLPSPPFIAEKKNFLFGWIPMQRKVASRGQLTDQLTTSRKSLRPPTWWRQTTTGLHGFGLRMPMQVENEINTKNYWK